LDDAEMLVTTLRKVGACLPQQSTSKHVTRNG
jgi:hypothetical protein